MRLKPVHYHIALIVFLLAIFIQSSIPGDELPEVGFKYFDKIIHFIIYAILFVLFFYSLNNQNKSVKLRQYAAEFSLLFTALYGLTDEFHQYFVPNRKSEFFDWLADVSGALAMYLIIKFFYQSKLKRAKRFNSIALIFSLLLFTGCKSLEGNSSDIEFRITKAEAWMDYMPKIIDETNRTEDINKNFHFLIEVTAVSNESLREEDFLIYNFQVEFNNKNSYYRRADFSTLIHNDRNYIILIKDMNEENYFSYPERLMLPEWVRFTFDIYLKGKKRQTINTDIIPIYKVY